MEHVKTFEQYILEEHPYDTYSGPNVVSGLADRIGHNFAASGSDGIISSAKPGGEFGGNNTEPTSSPSKRRWKYERTPKKKPSKKRVSALKRMIALQKEYDAKKVKDSKSEEKE